MFLLIVGIFGIVVSILLSIVAMYIGEEPIRSTSMFVAGITLTIGVVLILFHYDIKRYKRLKPRLDKFSNWYDRWERFERDAKENINSTHIREGFTLIELLVVIAIIAVLVGLLTTGIWAVLRKGPEITNKTELTKIDLALMEFKKKHNIYPPSRIKLCSIYKEYDVDNPLNPTLQFDRQCVATLNTIWPNLDWRQQFNWAGSNPLPPKGLIIEGHQCLVFFLGGIPNGSKQPPLGFHKNPQNPTIPIASGEVYKYFEFDGKRIDILKGTHFPSYVDTYNKSAPYIYFSSNKRPNGYVDIDNISFGIKPYTKNLREYYNSSTCQLISAGADGILGSGQSIPAMGSGRDDISNFWDNQLGVSP